ncbi:uncharacterized protein LOC127751421 [Frankliniella occidentalis]|uniref:Uncharacterized protein LOC127751421 n=1 Tax=Frankliniella occidentalis TaxID=133901 RepID=A0A9C6X8C5_FRAOC|nr:uncharacterized protein LOC127751421 [Frankliniella occidentalis]
MKKMKKGRKTVWEEDEDSNSSSEDETQITVPEEESDDEDYQPSTEEEFTDESQESDPEEQRVEVIEERREGEEEPRAPERRSSREKKEKAPCTLACCKIATVNFLEEVEIPTTVKEALSGPHAKEWEKAMDEEYDVLKGRYINCRKWIVDCKFEHPVAASVKCPWSSLS